MSDYEDYQRNQYEEGRVGVPYGWWNDPYFDLDPIFSVGRIFGGSPAPAIFPTVRVLPTPTPTGNGTAEAAGDSAVPEPSVAQVIDPEFRPTATVYEDAPAGIYETNRAETDWDRVYREYVILNAPVVVQEEPVFHDSIDWGGAVGTILGGVLDPFGIGDAARVAFAPRTTVTDIPSLGQQTTLAAPTAGAVMEGACPPVGPKYAKICLATGAITPLRRRRRRRLLTSSDIKDLSALKSIVGGAALQGAVVQAVRR